MSAPITLWQPHQIARAGVARTFQNIRLFPSMTVWEHLLVAQPHREVRARRLLPTRWADPAAQRRAQEVLSSLASRCARTPRAIAALRNAAARRDGARLTAAPKLLLLDEPVAGMNAEEADEVRTLLLQLRASGLTILLIEHDMTFVMNLCDYLYVLDFGVADRARQPSRSSHQSTGARRLSGRRGLMLEVRNLEVRYGAILAVRGVDLESIAARSSR